MPSYLNFRVRGIPLEYETRAQARELVSEALDLEPSTSPTVYSLAISPSDQNSRTATLSFPAVPERLSDRSEDEWVINLVDGDDLDLYKSLIFDTHFAGFTPLQRTSDRDCHVDLIVVCGLGGHALGSFKEKAGRFVWLRDALPLDVPQARVLTYGYDSHLVQSSSFQNLTDLGRALQLDLEGIRDPGQQRPIVFIGHSLGGLVIKETISRLKEEPRGPDMSILNAISGFLFFGVPHQGLAVECLVPLVKDSPNRALLESLNKNSPLLQRLQREFSSTLGTRRCLVVSFYETKESPTGVQVQDDKWKMIGPSKVLVEVSSATCGSQHQQPIDRNHSEMVKYSNAHDVLYKRVVMALRPLLSISGGRRHATGLDIGVNSLVSLSYDEKECLRSLSFQEQEHRCAEIHYANDTCEWLLEDSQYQAWMNKPRGLFWIKGNPGTGKSVLMKFAADMMSRRKSGELIVSFFIHGRGITLQKSPLGLFRALLNSMLRSFPAYLTELTGRFKDREERYGSYERSNGWRWTEKELETVMSQVLSKGTKSQPVVIFVDALDECGADEAKRLFIYFQNIMNDVESEEALVKICFSSRHYPILGQETTPKIYVEEKNDRDIRLVVRNRLKEIQPPEKRQKIETEILLKAHGGFQWAMLSIDMIHDGNTTGASTQSLHRNISTIPEGLNELYAAILSGASKEEKHQITKLFRWVLFAERPLSAQELREALATDQDMDYKTVQELRCHDNYSDSLSQFEIRVRHISRGLVEFQSREVWEVYELDGEDWDREAQFVHQSAADFILERFLNRVGHGSMSHVHGAGHYELSRSCLRYITLTEILDSGQLSRCQLSTRFPLLPYGVSSVLHHVKAVEKREIPQTDLLKLIQWDQPQRFRMLATIWRIMDPDRIHAPIGWPFEEATPLHVLVGFGSTSFLDVFLRKDEEQLGARDCCGNTPILVALRENLQEMALLLLNRSIAWQAEDEEVGSNVPQIGAGVEKRDYLVHVNAENDDGETPLGVAVSVRDDKAIQQLIDAGADVKNEKGLLFYAVNNRNKVLLSKLIQKGANLDGAVFFAVKSLSRTDHDDDDSLRELLSELFEAGANTSKYMGLYEEYEDECDEDDDHDESDGENDWGDEEAIIVASRKGRTDLVSFLLSHGVSTTVQGKRGVFPLLAATINDHLETVKVLLRAAPEAVRLKDDAGKTALDVATSYDSFDLALHLIQQGEGADIPLQLFLNAVEENELELVKAILLADESLMEMANKRDTKPFEVAVRGGYHEMAELLLGVGEADINPLGYDGRTAFWSTLIRRDLRMAKMLLGTGAINVNEKNVDGQTPMWWAIEERNEGLVKLLVGTGEVDVLQRGKDGKTPFWWAIEEGNEDLARLFFEVETPDIFEEDVSGRMTFWFTVFGERIGLVLETVLASGKFDFNRKDRSGRTLISQAAFFGNAELFKLLFETGRVNLKVIDNYGSSLLSLAVQGGSHEIVQLLLNRTRFDINAKDVHGRTLLSLAEQSGKDTIVQLLLDRAGFGKVEAHASDFHAVARPRPRLRIPILGLTIWTFK